MGVAKPLSMVGTVGHGRARGAVLGGGGEEIWPSAEVI